VPIDIQAYQRFWRSLPVETLDQLQNKAIAVHRSHSECRIVAVADTLSELHELLRSQGIELRDVICDRIPRFDESASGIEFE
jgi:hypothetical protein